MKNIKYLDKIIIGLLVCIALAFIIFAKNPSIKAGVGCLCFGFVALATSWIVKRNNDKEMFNFEVESREILIDIANNGESSKYFGVIDISTINKLRAKMIKRNRKQVISCAILGVVLIIAAFMCFV